MKLTKQKKSQLQDVLATKAEFARQSSVFERCWAEISEEYQTEIPTDKEAFDENTSGIEGEFDRLIEENAKLTEDTMPMVKAMWSSLQESVQRYSAMRTTLHAEIGFQKQEAENQASMAKMTAARTAMEVGAQTIQLFGGYGYMTEYEVERYYREAKTVELHLGARDVHKDIIAGAVIGKIQ